MKNGYIVKKFEGNKIPLKFGTNAFELLCEMHGKYTLGDVDFILKMVGGERDLIFCAAKCAANRSGNEIAITKEDAGDWLDGMSQKDYAEIMAALMQTTIKGKTLQEYTEDAEEAERLRLADENKRLLEKK